MARNTGYSVTLNLSPEVKAKLDAHHRKFPVAALHAVASEILGFGIESIDDRALEQRLVQRREQHASIRSRANR